MTKQDLHPSECSAYFLRYINKLADKTELRQGFELGKDSVMQFFKSIPREKLTYRYQRDKWSVKEVFQHLIDTERIFMYRCFRIARRDDAALTGYDQNIYVKPSNAGDKSLDNLLNEFVTNRQHSISLLNSLTDEDLCFVGNASGNPMSARAAAFIVIGHDLWHEDVIKQMYL